MQHLAVFVANELKARGYEVDRFPVDPKDAYVSNSVKVNKAIAFKADLYLSLHSDASLNSFGLAGDDCKGWMTIIPQCHDDKAAAVGMAMLDAIESTAGYKTRSKQPKRVRRAVSR